MDRAMAIRGGWVVALLMVGCSGDTAKPLASLPPVVENPAPKPKAVTVDWNTWTQGPTLQMTGQVECIAFSVDGKLLAAGSDAFIEPPGYESEPGKKRPEMGEIRVWEVATGAVVTTIRDDRARIQGVAFSPDGRTLAAVTSEHGKTWSCETWSPRFDFGTRFGDHVAFSRDSKLILSDVRNDDDFDSWDASTGQGRRYSPVYVAEGIQSPDGRLMAFYKQVRAFASGEIVATASDDAPFGYRRAFSPDGNWLVGISGQLMTTWAVPEFGVVTSPLTKRLIASATEEIAVSFDSKVAALIKQDEGIGIYNIQTLQDITTIRSSRYPSHISMSPVEPRLAADGSVGEIRTWIAGRSH